MHTCTRMCKRERERQTDRQTEKKRNRQTDRDRLTDRDRKRQTDKQREKTKKWDGCGVGEVGGRGEGGAEREIYSRTVNPFIWGQCALFLMSMNRHSTTKSSHKQLIFAHVDLLINPICTQYMSLKCNPKYHSVSHIQFHQDQIKTAQ